MGMSLERAIEPGDPRRIRCCAEHGPEHDASYLPGRDFAVSDESSR
jgi:hypothetical protein